MLDRFLALVIQNYVWIVAIAVLGISWYIIQLVRGQRRLSNAQFQLERERASNDRGNAFVWLALLLIVIGASSYANFSLRDGIDPSLFAEATPSAADLPNFGATLEPTATRPVRAELPTPTPVIASTATLRSAAGLTIDFAEESVTAIPTLEVEGLIEGCIGDAIIRDPASGRTISGGTSIFGKAMADDFAFYRFDILGPSTGEAWEPLLPNSFSQPVREGFLASVELATWETGVYQLRLSVFSQNNTLSDSCVIEIGIVN